MTRTERARQLAEAAALRATLAIYGMGATDLAEAMGTHPHGPQRWLNGTTSPTPTSRRRIAAVLAQRTPAFLADEADK